MENHGKIAATLTHLVVAFYVAPHALRTRALIIALDPMPLAAHTCPTDTACPFAH